MKQIINNNKNTMTQKHKNYVTRFFFIIFSFIKNSLLLKLKIT